MRIRTFTGKSTHEAMSEVRADMGADAVIISVRTSAAGNVEIRAAVEDDDGEAIEREISGVVANPALSSLEHLLTDQGAPVWFAEGVARSSGQFTGPAALIEGFFERLKTEPIDAAPARPIVLAGLAGSGKTLAAAKLAARARHAGADVELICAAPDRPGAFSALCGLAEEIGVRVQAIECAERLAGVLRRNRHSRATRIIDCAPVSLMEVESSLAVHRLALEADAEIVAVMSATANPADLMDAAQLFRSLGAHRAIVTQMDLTRRRAGVLAAVVTGRMRFAQVGLDDTLSSGLVPATAQRLARLVLDATPEQLMSQRGVA